MTDETTTSPDQEPSITTSGWSSAPEPISIDLGRGGRRGFYLPEPDVGQIEPAIPANLMRTTVPAWPEMSESEVVRHFIRLSIKNHHVDKNLYPLGSCTMKYNPKVCEVMARLPGMVDLHPLQDDVSMQGALALMWKLEQLLAAISGFEAVSLQPAAGAQGELAGLMMIRAYHEANGEDERRKRVLLPDSAHGTNPASVTLNGFTSHELKSNDEGRVDLDELKASLGDDVAAIMITNPNTLGLFESDIDRICELVHEAGGLVYMDGANLNALLGIIEPGAVGIDVMHFNLHKTFGTPHGGGGPGAGPIGVVGLLEPFLPVPRIIRKKNPEAEGDFVYGRDWDRPQSIGKVHGHYGNFGVMVRAYCYILALGREGLADVSRAAVINANYLMHQLLEDYDLPYAGPCMHEFVLSGSRQKTKYGVATTDIAKRLLDFGFYAPTVYFPLIVPEALMIEPTETETRETLDSFARALQQIAREAAEEPLKVRGAPYNTPVCRPDEALAAKFPDLRWRRES